ncbi:unnamed protein product [Peniophora sp. CBMAI 1063]|nr:unnamed protein product [Peniophora sp. CBMAI 1063]
MQPWRSICELRILHPRPTSGLVLYICEMEHNPRGATREREPSPGEATNATECHNHNRDDTRAPSALTHTSRITLLAEDTALNVSASPQDTQTSLTTEHHVHAAGAFAYSKSIRIFGSNQDVRDERARAQENAYARDKAAILQVLTRTLGTEDRATGTPHTTKVIWYEQGTVETPRGEE